MDFFSACDQMAELVEESIRDLVGTPEGGETVRMGADLTPTKKIDQVAEDCVLAIPEENTRSARFLSVKRREKSSSRENGARFFLTRLTGRSMLLPGSPFMRCPSRMRKRGIPRRHMCETLQAGRPSLQKKENLRGVITSPSAYRRSVISTNAQ